MLVGILRAGLGGPTYTADLARAIELLVRDFLSAIANGSGETLLDVRGLHERIFEKTQVGFIGKNAVSFLSRDFL